MTARALTLNAGSSSIKFGLFELAQEPALRLSGQVSRIGGEPRLEARAADGAHLAERDLAAGRAADHAGAVEAILELLAEHVAPETVEAVGHRVVHGGPEHAEPVVLTDAVIDGLARLSPFAPLHQPHNLAGVAAARAAFPAALQVACFDTAFHRTNPWVSETFALPREYFERGVRRYGFHGLSYDYIAGELARGWPALHSGRVVVAHLGNGASMCAMRGGLSVGSTMGLTALDGLPMGTRCGQIDPGVLIYMMRQEGMDGDAIADLLYTRSGLLGLSGLSNDMRTLEASDTAEAAEAIAYFVFRIRRELGALAAVLGGLDALVFTGGIGENSARVRAAACEGQEWLGIAVDPARNAAGARDISAEASRTPVLVIPTDEEIVIARAAARLLAEAE
jgi:acetate kinase